MPYDAEGLGSLSLTIAAIVVLLFAGLWAVRRARPGLGYWAGRDCSVLRSLALGPRERLMVVRVGARHLVVGVGGGAVSLLCELDEPLTADSRGEDTFAEAIRKSVGRWRGN